jgi:SAM-dependent methyltransferase
MTAAAEARGSGVGGLLDYYLRHGLNPVRYEMANRDWHFQRRASLCRSLGVHPLTVRNSRVLEVAAGSGQNSLYLASLRPRHFTLVEPNPVAVRDIKALYREPEFAPWRPTLFEGKLEDFEAEEPFDLVVCENWLGHRPQERDLLRKLGSLVASGGLLVVTTVSPVGLLPNVLRRLLALRLGSCEDHFEDSTRLLVAAFGPHLQTMAGMTRNHTDWVQDNLINPHYFNILLTIPMVAEDLGASFSFVGSSPDFAVDWRWFKSLYGEARDFNGHFLSEYYCNAHNFLDYRQVSPRGDLAQNRDLDAAAGGLIATAAEIDLAARGGRACPADGQLLVLSQLKAVLGALEIHSSEHTLALREFEHAYRMPQLGPEDVRNMQAFGGLFGREVIYVSLEKAA